MWQGNAGRPLVQVHYEPLLLMLCILPRGKYKNKKFASTETPFATDINRHHCWTIGLSFPPLLLHDILDDDHIQWHPPLIGYYTNFWPLLIWTLLLNLTFYLSVQGFHRTYATGAACQQRTLTPPDTWSCPVWDLQMFYCWDHWLSIIHYTSLWHISLTWLYTEFDVITQYRFP